MQIRTVRRSLAALAIAAVLGLAGADPAAAAGPGWFERSLAWLAGLWAAEEAGAKAQPKGEGLFSIWASSEGDRRGYGMDPNGVPGMIPPPGDEQP